jgi:hypothetical protein
MSRKSSEELQLQWKENILKQQQSGLSIAAWCFQNNIVIHTFYYWRGKLFPKSLDRNAFTEVIPDNNRGSGISLEYQGVQVHLSQNFDPSVLQACLKVLKTC